MNRETAVLDEVVEHETEKTAAGANVPRAAKLAANAPSSVQVTTQPGTPISKTTVRERIRQMFAKLAKALEGDHGHQNYR